MQSRRGAAGRALPRPATSRPRDLHVAGDRRPARRRSREDRRRLRDGRPRRVLTRPRRALPRRGRHPRRRAARRGRGAHRHAGRGSTSCSTRSSRRPARRADLHLVVAGGAGRGQGGPASTRLAGARRRRSPGAHWLGPRADVPDLLADLDLFVLPSTEPEPYGLVVVEALASGTPVVVTDAGGPRRSRRERRARERPPGPAAATPARWPTPIVAAVADAGPSTAPRGGPVPRRTPEPDRFAALFRRVAGSVSRGDRHCAASGTAASRFPLRRRVSAPLDGISRSSRSFRNGYRPTAPSDWRASAATPSPSSIDRRPAFGSTCTPGPRPWGSSMRYALTHHLQLGSVRDVRLGRRALRAPVARACARRASSPPTTPAASSPSAASTRRPTARTPGRRVGIELEWLTFCLDDDLRRAPLARRERGRRRVRRAPGGSRVTFEPGGQVELSTKPFPDLAAVRGARRRRRRRSATRWPAAGIGLVGLGLDPGPPTRPRRPLAALRRDGGVLRRVAGPPGAR